MRNLCYQRPRDRHKYAYKLLFRRSLARYPAGRAHDGPQILYSRLGHRLPRHHPLDLWHHVRGASLPPPHPHKCSRAPDPSPIVCPPSTYVCPFLLQSYFLHIHTSFLHFQALHFKLQFGVSHTVRPLRCDVRLLMAPFCATMPSANTCNRDVLSIVVSASSSTSPVCAAISLKRSVLVLRKFSAWSAVN